MILQNTPNLNLMFMGQYQQAKDILFNENIIKIDILLNTYLSGNITGENTPPEDKNIEDGLYFIGNNPTGIWAGIQIQEQYNIDSKAGYLARFFENQWIYVKPNEGLLLWHKYNKKLYVFHNTEFKEIGMIN